MEPSSPRYSSVSRHVSAGKSGTTILCWKDPWRTQEDESASTPRHFSHCTGVLVLPHFSSSQCYLATDSRSRNWLSHQSVPFQFSSYHCRTFMDPSLQRSTWLPSDTSTIGIFPEEKAQEPSIQVLSCEDFYQHPAELEEVTNNELLGFLVDSNTRTVTYKSPEPWQTRDFASAGSLRLRLSGLQSRCHLISRYSYPKQESPRLIHSLILLYGAKGFPIPDCCRVIPKIQKEV